MIRDSERPLEGSNACKKLRRKAAPEEKDCWPEVFSDLGEKSDGQALVGDEAGSAELRRKELLQRLSSTAAGEQPLLPQAPKTKVAPSTLAKLSRFSFAGLAEEQQERPETTDYERGTSSERGQDRDRAPGHGGTNPGKRKCFEFGSKSILPGQSLFSTSVIDDGELDVDWEAESTKRPKL
ncbi:hypothetical protein GJAV_G00118540 [Gymnothorax javanicus]|nr:hypothetical protein GJAV_G00118540 [Gymnothorax javanicus]